MQVTGPISSLPGSRHKVPAGTKCDECGQPAVIRIQGETDSMGSEMHDLCLTHGAQREQNSSISGECDWCHNRVDELKPTRDYDEGYCGPVYYVCKECERKIREQEAIENQRECQLLADTEDWQEDEVPDEGEEPDDERERRTR